MRHNLNGLQTGLKTEATSLSLIGVIEGSIYEQHKG
jgi:hypothetical protein